MNDIETSLVPVRTSPYLSKYECARVLGLRVLQLQEGEGDEDPLRKAILEVRERRNPCILRRYLPDGSHEDVAVASLKHDRYLLSYQLNAEPS